MSEMRKRVFPKGKVRDVIRKTVEDLDLEGGTSETIADMVIMREGGGEILQPLRKR